MKWETGCGMDFQLWVRGGVSELGSALSIRIRLGGVSELETPDKDGLNKMEVYFPLAEKKSGSRCF